MWLVLHVLTNTYDPSAQFPEVHAQVCDSKLDSC